MRDSYRRQNFRNPQQSSWFKAKFIPRALKKEFSSDASFHIASDIDWKKTALTAFMLSLLISACHTKQPYMTCPSLENGSECALQAYNDYFLKCLETPIAVKPPLSSKDFEQQLIGTGINLIDQHDTEDHERAKKMVHLFDDMLVRDNLSSTGCTRTSLHVEPYFLRLLVKALKDFKIPYTKNSKLEGAPFYIGMLMCEGNPDTWGGGTLPIENFSRNSAPLLIGHDIDAEHFNGAFIMINPIYSHYFGTIKGIIDHETFHIIQLLTHGAIKLLDRSLYQNKEIEADTRAFEHNADCYRCLQQFTDTRATEPTEYLSNAQATKKLKNEIDPTNRCLVHHLLEEGFSEKYIKLKMNNGELEI